MKYFIILAVILIFLSQDVKAQSTATNVQLGYLATSGCPGSQHSCWVPYTIANPLPASSQ